MTSETTADIEPTTIATTTESSIEASSTETTTNAETPTDSGTMTTTEARTTTAKTTTALPTTTSGAGDTCSDLGGSYITAYGQDFSFACNQCYVGICTIVDPFQADSFESYIDSCSSNVECEAVDYERTGKTCYLFKLDDNVTLEDNPDYNVAVKQE
ncbi:hypothetical protein ACHAPO_008441 [Fusarium lateritium]